MGFFTSLLMMLTSCEYFVDVDFEVATEPQDTLVIKRWGYSYNGRCDTIPYTNQSGKIWEQTVTEIKLCMLHTMGGPSVSISEENAFTSLISQYDSIKIIRKSDGASTITYHNGDNATDEQRYFFTRDAWICSPDIEGYEGDRTYTLKLTDDMFH